MKESFKISIPKPCHEDWNQMKSQTNGRFCGSCSKNVVDFSGMKANEIRDYFIIHQNERVCGRFEKQQLDSLVISIPRQVLISQTRFHKIFLLALFVTMGTTLFSCADPYGDKRSIDGIEIVENSGGAVDSIGADSLPPPPTRDRYVLGMTVSEPSTPRITVYKDSITMSEGY